MALRNREGCGTSGLAVFLLEQSLAGPTKKPAQGRQEGWHR